MSKHIETVHISTDEFARINRLLAIDSLDEMSDEELVACGANTNCRERIFRVIFDNGSFLSFDLCSGNFNYWDDIIWTDVSGYDVCIESTYELADIEFDVEGETYIIKIVKDQ